MNKRIAVVGYGEAGQIFAAAFAALPGCAVTAFDILVEEPARRDALQRTASAAGVVLADTMDAAVADADVVFSAVTATSAFGVAERAATLLSAGQYFVDINSVSPETKRRSHALHAARSVAYVEAAVMASVPPYGIKVPILLGGPNAAAFMALMAGSGMDLKVASSTVGIPSAIKMCRSIMIKGIEALTVESMLAARHYGVEDQVIASLDETFPSMDWQRQADYLVSRVVQHGRRRAAEMREVAHTVADARIEPLMASAVAQRQDWMADQVGAGIVGKSEKHWRVVADAIAAGPDAEMP